MTILSSIPKTMTDSKLDVSVLQRITTSYVENLH
jgi:hypothetical protein